MPLKMRPFGNWARFGLRTYSNTSFVDIQMFNDLTCKDSQEDEIHWRLPSDTFTAGHANHANLKTKQDHFISENLTTKTRLVRGGCMVQLVSELVVCPNGQRYEILAVEYFNYFAVILNGNPL
jgi:hypothetical protein